MGDPLIWPQPTAQFLTVLRSQGRGTRRDSCVGARFIDPSTPRFSEYAFTLEQALLLIERVAPGFRGEINHLIDCVVLVDEGGSFRGASGLAFRGMIMLSPEPGWTICTFAEELVHEMTHSLLDIISIREPLLKGDHAFDELYAAPFRPDKRPLYGNFHAVVVVSRLIHLFQAFERHGIVEPGTIWNDKVQEYARRSVEPLATLRAHGHLSQMARRLLDMLVEPTLKTTLAI
jgi:HEXXH motif-containing protein